MKKNVRALKLTFLMLGLACYSVPQYVCAEQLNALGQLITKGSVAYIDNSPIPSGTTVLAGDKIRALNAPALLSLTNGGRVELTPNTVISVSGEGQTLQITQTSGKARFYVPKNVALTIVTPKAKVKTVSAAQGFAGVVTVENNRVSFTSETGEFNVSDEDSKKTSTVRDGQSTSVPASDQSDQSSASKGSGTAAGTAGTAAGTAGGIAGAHIGAWVAVGAAIAGGATAVAVAAASNNDNGGLVSPARP